MVEWPSEARPLCSASLLSGPVRCTAAQYVNPQCILSSCTMYSVDAQCALYNVICRCRNAFCGVLQAAASTSWPLKGWMGSEALRPLAGRAGSGSPVPFPLRSREGTVLMGKLLTPRFAPAALSSEGNNNFVTKTQIESFYY